MDATWKKQLRREASLHHMCRENRSALEDATDKVSAIALYKKTIDWALENNYPALSTIRGHFSDAEHCGVFVDKHFSGELLNDHQVYVFHHCTGEIRTGLNLSKRIIPMLYFANGCDMVVTGDSPSQVYVPVYIFGENKVEAQPSDSIQPKIFRKC